MVEVEVSAVTRKLSKRASSQVVLGRNPSLMTDREVQVLKITRTDRDELAGVLFAYSTHSTSLGPRNYLISGDVHGLVQGRATRLLHDGGAWNRAQVGARLSRSLSPGTPPATGAAFVEGFVAGSGTVLVHDRDRDPGPVANMPAR